MKLFNNTIILSVVTSTALMAAAPNLGNIEKQVEPPKEIIKEKETPLVELGGVKKYVPAMVDDKSGKTIFVKSFVIEGAIHISEEKLQSLISSYNNKDLTFSEIKNVTSIITKEYRDEGYFVARAYIPVQNMQEGIVTISIIEGNYGEFKLNNSSRVKDTVVQGMLEYARKDDVISTNTLEQAMLIINDTPGVIVTKADVLAGKEVGTSDFAIDTESSSLYSGYVIGDNYGSAYTGENRLMSGVSVNSPFEIGDKVSVGGLISNGSDLKNGRASYSVPLMSNGLRGEIAYSKTSYTLVNLPSTANGTFSGDLDALDLTFTYPIIRTRIENLNAILNFAKKDMNTRELSDITAKEINVMNLGLEYNQNSLFFGLDAQDIASITYTLGNLDFKDPAKKAFDESGVDTNGTYSKVLVTLGKDIDFTNLISLENILKLQHSLDNKNLDGSEDFSIGGSDEVKVYPSGELGGENGYLFETELKYKLPRVDSYASTIGLFYDRGRAYMANNVIGFEAKTLQDVGIGYYLTYKNLFANTKLVWIANSPEIKSEKNENSKVLFQGGLTF